MNKLIRFYLSMFTCYAADASGGSGGDTAPPPEDPKIAVLEKNLADMTSLVSTLAQGQAGNQTAIETLADAIKQSNTKPPTDEPDISLDELETMSRADMIKLIQAGNAKDMEKAIAKVMEKITSTDNKLDEAITSVTVEKFKETHADLLEWRTEIGNILKSGRASNVADAYTIARNENAEKVKTVDAKYGEKSPEPEKFKGSFTGFPGDKTSGGTGNKRMTSNDAALAAWDEATSAMPGIEQFLNSTS